MQSYLACTNVNEGRILGGESNNKPRGVGSALTPHLPAQFLRMEFWPTQHTPVCLIEKKQTSLY